MRRTPMVRTRTVLLVFAIGVTSACSDRAATTSRGTTTVTVEIPEPGGPASGAPGTGTVTAGTTAAQPVTPSAPSPPTAPSATVSELASAPVPAYCDMPAQTLVGGRTAARWKPRGGEISTGDALLVDLDGDGGRELVARFSCSAGGVSWPHLLLVYSHGPVLRGSVRLGDLGKQEHGDVERWSAAGAAVTVLWTSYEGAGFDINHHVSRLSMSGGKVVFVDTEPVFSENRQAERVVNRFLAAAVAKDTQTMKSLASPAAYTEFTKHGTTWRSPGKCTIDWDSSQGCETTIGADGVGLIFHFRLRRNTDGTMVIAEIQFRGDAG